MLAALYNRDAVYQQRRSARRNHVVDRDARPLLEGGKVGHVPHRDDSLLPAELLIEDRRVQSVLSRVRIQLSKPLIACIGLARLRNRSGHERSEDSPHRAGRYRITNDDLALPLRINEIVPILRRIGFLDGVAIVADDLGSQVGAVPVVICVATFRIDRGGPRGLIRLQQTFPGRAIERLRRRAEPDIGLWIRLLRAHPLENFLRAHVYPLYIDAGMRLLEPLFEVLEQLLPVRRIHDENLATI